MEKEIEKPNECSNPSLTRAENGYILSYEEKIPRGEFDYRMEYCKEVFTAKEGAKALARLDEIYGTGDKD